MYINVNLFIIRIIFILNIYIIKKLTDNERN